MAAVGVIIEDILASGPTIMLFGGSVCSLSWTGRLFKMDRAIGFHSWFGGDTTMVKC